MRIHLGYSRKETSLSGVILHSKNSSPTFIMIARTFCLFLLAASLVPAAKVDLVQLGKQTFDAVGCAECHAVAKNDDSVKTGPGLYGLFTTTARERTVIESAEEHKVTLKADLDYFKKSIRKPAEEIAIAETGPTKGTAFQPVMPAYPEAFLNEQKAMAVFHYLRTLNDGKNKGPGKVMGELEDGTAQKDIHQNGKEILVTDRTRIYRARVKGNSARAIYVGLPSGLNYSFDPRTMTISKAWWGGFLNITGECDGRGRGHTTMGYQAKEITLAGTPKINKREVDLSFKSPLIGDTNTIAKNLHGDEDFLDQLKAADARLLGYTYAAEADGPPTFHYKIGKDLYQLTFNIDQKGTARWVVKVNGQKSVKTQKTDAPSDIWRPNAIPSNLTQLVGLTPISKMILLPGYKAERVPAPTDPHGRPQLFEPVGMDLDPKDGSMVVTTRTAGVWRFKNNTWTMIAEGLLDSLGVIVEKDRLIVGQKTEITELRDLNEDGFYETFVTLSDDFLITDNYHEYLHGPAKGEDGNYYFLLNLSHSDGKNIHKANGRFMGSQGGYRGWALQVTPDGETTPFAMGLRSPAGLATGPDGKLYYTENQGEYNGTSKLHHLQEGRYYGHPSGLVDLPGMKPSSAEIQWDKWVPKREVSLALLPQSRVANSPGSPTWDTTGGKFGPFKGEMYCGDQTLSTLFRILPKKDNEAAVINFAEGFPSGVMRLCFDQDGALFVGQTGRGWRARGGSQQALVKMSYVDTDEPLLHDITRDGETFTLHFTGEGGKLPKSSGLAVESWFYHDKPSYGSPTNNKLNETIASEKLDPANGTITITLVPNPKREQGSRVFRFSSKNLPKNRNGALEAYFTKSK